MAENFVILFVIAALAAGFALVLFTAMWRVERRAQFGREAGIKRSQRLERRVFLIGVALVVALVAVVVTVQLSRAPACRGTVGPTAGRSSARASRAGAGPASTPAPRRARSRDRG